VKSIREWYASDLGTLVTVGIAWALMLLLLAIEFG
jgi:hypothetical protein